MISTVEGLKNLDEIATADKGAVKKFPVEAVVRDLKEMAGGREVLFQFDGAPYWKRFSLSRNEWLPLPPVKLENVYVTGNAAGLYVLDRGAGEVRKFAISDLRELASAKLPGEKDYVAILAGSNSDRAPVHVLMQNGVMSLDPDSLQRRGLVI